MGKERAPESAYDFRAIWDHHDNVVDNTPERDVLWGQNSTREEAEEWSETAIEKDEEHFLEEGADVIISYMTTMKAAGFSYEVALQAVWCKLNVVLDRALDTQEEVERSGRSWDESYNHIKARQIYLVAQWKSKSVLSSRLEVRLSRGRNNMPNENLISHGKNKHSIEERKNCPTCKKIDKWFDDEVKEAGGIEQLMEEMGS